jgi:hypothetical protein
LRRGEQGRELVRPHGKRLAPARDRS